MDTGHGTWWVRDGYTITATETDSKYTPLSTTGLRWDVAWQGTGDRPTDILETMQSTHEMTGVVTNVGESLQKVTPGIYTALSNSNGADVPGHFDYIIEDASWKDHVAAGNYKDGYANLTAGKGAAQPHGFMTTKSAGTKLVWDDTQKVYKFDGTAVDYTDIYVIGGKIGVFTNSDGTKLYTGTVYGKHNEILMTAKKGDDYYSYWAAKVTDPGATMETYRVEDYAIDMLKMAENDTKLHNDGIKEVKAEKTADGKLQLSLVRNAVKDGANIPVDGTVTIAGGGGTGGKDTYVQVGIGTASQTFQTGSKVVANRDGAAGTHLTHLTHLTINGTDYAIPQGKTYTAGTNINITDDGVISATDANTTLVAGKAAKTVDTYSIRDTAGNVVTLDDVASATKLADITTQVNTNTTNIATNTANISNLTTTVEGHTTEINSLTTTVNEHTSNITTLQGQVITGGTANYGTNGTGTATLNTADGSSVTVNGLKDTFVQSGTVDDNNKLTLTRNDGTSTEIDLGKVKGTTYTAGKNITITEGVISATDTTLVEGAAEKTTSTDGITNTYSIKDTDGKTVTIDDVASAAKLTEVNNQVTTNTANIATNTANINDLRTTVNEHTNNITTLQGQVITGGTASYTDVGTGTATLNKADGSTVTVTGLKDTFVQSGTVDDNNKLTLTRNDGTSTEIDLGKVKGTTYTAGKNITITEGVISATDTTLVEGAAEKNTSADGITNTYSIRDTAGKTVTLEDVASATKLADITTQVNTNTTNIATNTANITTNTNNISNLTTTVEGHTTEINSLNTTVGEHTTKITNIEGQLWTAQVNGTDVKVKDGKVNFKDGDHITVTSGADGEITFSATGLADTSLTNITEGGRTVITNIAKGADRHIKATKAGQEYTVDADGNVTMTYVDGNGIAVDGEQAVIKGVARKEDITNISGQLWTAQADGKDVTAKEGKVNFKGSDHITVTKGADGEMIFTAKDLADTSLTNITEGGRTVITNIAKGADRHIKATEEGHEYTVDADGNVTMTYVDGAGNAVAGEQAVIKGVASKDDITNISGQLWTAQANGTDVAAKEGKVNFKGSDHITVTKGADGEMIFTAKDLADTSLTNITEGGRTVITNIAKGADRHIKATEEGHEYTVDADGNVTMTYVDGAGNAVAGEQAVIKGVASKTALDALDDFAVKYDKDDVGKVNKNSVTLGGADYHKSTTDAGVPIYSGGTRITNVAYAAGDVGSEAVNVDYLKDRIAEASKEAAAGHTVVTAEGQAAPADKTYTNGNIQVKQTTDAKGKATYDVKLNDTIQLGGGKVMLDGKTGSAAIGNVVVMQDKITGLRAGLVAADSTDAVNGSQLHAVQLEAEKKTTVSAGKNVTVTPTTEKDGHMNYEVSLKNTVVLGSGDMSIVLDGDNGRIQAGAVEISRNGIAAGGTKITGVAAGEDPFDAVNVSQLREAAAASKTTVSAGKNMTVTTATAEDGHVDYQVNLKEDVDLGETISLKGSEGTASVGHVTVNGAAGTVNGLTNKTWDPEHIVSGQAATEDQLKAVDAKASQAQATHTVVTAEGKEAEGETYTDGNIQVNKKTGENGQATYDVKLNDVITLGGNITIDGTANQITFAGGMTFDGRESLITDLSNKSFSISNGGYKDYKESGRAATEGQLYDAFMFLNDKIDGITIADPDNNITVDKTPGGTTGGGTGGDTAVEQDPKESPKFELGLNDTKITLGDTTNHVDIEGTQGKVTVSGSYNVGDTVVNKDGISVGREGGASLKKDSLTVGGKTYISETGINANDQKITNVADGEISENSKDAVNGSQLYASNQRIENNTQNISILNNYLGSLDKRVNEAAAGAAALAGLHPLDFDPDDKLSFSAGYGHYHGEGAAALGAYYQPNENVLVGASTTIGNGDEMWNATLSFKLGRGSGLAMSRTAMARKMKDMEEENADLKNRVDLLSAQVEALLGLLDTTKSKDFPDVPENHWAYEAVSRLGGNGIVEGFPDGEFKGDRTMTRYEMAQMIYNALQKGVEAEARLIEEFRPELRQIAESSRK